MGRDCRRSPAQPPAHAGPALGSDQVAQGFTQSGLGNLGGWRQHSLSGHPVSVLNCPHSGNILPHIQSEPPLFQLMPSVCCPPLMHHCVEPAFIIFISSLQVLEVTVRSPPKLSFLQPCTLSLPSQAMCSSALTILVALHWTHSHVSLSLLYWRLKTGCNIQTWCQQDLTEGKDPLPRPAGNTLPNAAQGTVGLLCCDDALLAHGQPGVYQDTQVLSAELLPCQSAPACVVAWGLFLPRCQTWHLSLMKFINILEV